MMLVASSQDHPNRIDPLLVTSASVRPIYLGRHTYGPIDPADGFDHTG